MIDKFARTHAFLSNFYMSPFTWRGDEYESAEHAFQAAKATNDKDREKVLSKKTPSAAKKAGRKIKIREDWAEVKVEIMLDILRAKFSNDDLAEKLRRTDGRELVESNNWGDRFWGVDEYGENKLGLLLMQVRAEVGGTGAPGHTKDRSNPGGEVFVELKKPEIETDVETDEAQSTKPFVHVPELKATYLRGNVVSIGHLDEVKQAAFRHWASIQLAREGAGILEPVDAISEPVVAPVAAVIASTPSTMFDLPESASIPFGVTCSCGAQIEDVDAADPYRCSRCRNGENVDSVATGYIIDPTKNREIPQEPEGLPTITAILDTYRNKPNNPLKRGEAIGAGRVAGRCDRETWLQWRWAYVWVPEPDLERIFERGNWEEPRMIKRLRLAGVRMFTTRAEEIGAPWTAQGFNLGTVQESWHVFDPFGQPVKGFKLKADAEEHAEYWNQKQIKVTALCGHLGGRLDGVGVGFKEAPKSPHVWEQKTGNAKALAHMKKHKVEASKPEHFGQMQIYMRIKKIERAFYLFTGKDDEEIYGERVKLDREKADALIERARKIVESQAPPERIRNDKTYYPCKFCDAKEICHGSKAPDVNCRTCVHSTPVLDGVDRESPLWICELGGGKVPIDKFRQVYGCGSHLFIPDLLSPEFTFERAENSPAPSWMLYRDKSGQPVFNVTRFDGPVDWRSILGTEAFYTSAEFAQASNLKPIDTYTDHAKLKIELEENVPF